MVSIITHLTNATESARILLLIQERTITNTLYDPEMEELVKSTPYPEVGFSEDIAREIPPFAKDLAREAHRLTFFGLWRLTSLTSLLGNPLHFLLGPALMLVPRFHHNLSWKNRQLDFTIRKYPLSYYPNSSGIRTDTIRRG